MSKIALVIGGTGLVGSKILNQLLTDERFTSVIAFGRKKSGKSAPKLEEHVVDFEAPAVWESLVKGDVAFSALGTTIGQAGSQAAQKKVDYTYQFEFAKAAAKHHVPTFVLCSSGGANAKSHTFYSRIKGELDRDVQGLGFERVRIMRPSLLGGERKNARAGEKIGSVVLGAVNAIGIARKYREISGDIVAKAMINSAFDPKPGTSIYELDHVFEEAERAR